MASRLVTLGNTSSPAVLEHGLHAPRFLLLYSPLQFGLKEMAKPGGCLSVPYLAGALREAGFHVDTLDISVGNRRDKLQDTFFKPVALPSGLFRIGMSEARILEEVASYDVIGISSIFTAQTRMVLDTVRLVRRRFPDKLIISGGVNARRLAKRFFDAGGDIIAVTEAEQSIVAIGNVLRRGARHFRDIPGTLLRADGPRVLSPASTILENLDDLPLRAWDLLPNHKDDNYMIGYPDQTLAEIPDHHRHGAAAH